jgi:PAS domain S-box-containing protein
MRTWFEGESAAATDAEDYLQLLGLSIQGKLLHQRGRVVFANEAAAELYGFDTAAALEALVSIADLPGDVAGADDASFAALAAQSPFRRRVAQRRKNGETWIADVLVRVTDWRGAPTVQMAVMDATAEEALKTELTGANQRYRRALAGTRTGVWEVENGAREAYASTRLREILGHPADAAFDLDKDLYCRAAPADVERLRAAARASLETGAPFDVKFRYRRPDGQEIWLHSRGVVAREEGGALRFTGATEDVTAEEQAHRALAEASRRAEAAAEAKSRFLATMSHEIRTPLNAILGMAALLARTALDAEQAELVRHAERAGKHLLALLNDVLDYSRLDSGDLSLAPQDIDLCAELDAAMAVAQPRAMAKGLTLRFTQEIGPLRVHADPLRLRQVVLNLIDNAVKFTPSGEVHVLARAEQVDGAVQLRVDVEDTGPGVPPEKLALIFEAFAQADAGAARGHDGAGLGLSIADGFARAMGGGVTADNRPEGGACFTFTAALPVVAEVPEPSTRTETGEPALRILVAEDNPENQTMMRLILTELGCACVVAENGAVALDIFENSYFDAVLMDLHMPVMDGIEAAKRIRARTDRRASTPIIAVTADARTGVREAVLEAGMNAYITKPINFPELIAALEACIWSSQDAPATSAAG